MKELYTSPLFRKRRAHVERTCDRWYVLSAKHGLIGPLEEIDPYDACLGDVSVHLRRAWSEEVAISLRAELGAFQDVTFEIHAGKDYYNNGLEARLLEWGAHVEKPVQGLSQGNQLAWYCFQ